MKLDQDGVLVKIPFDAPNVKLTMARVYKDKVAEVDVTHDSVRSNATVEYKPEETLESAYQEWETKRREETEKENAEEEQQEEEDVEVVVEQADEDAGTTRRAETNAANNGRAKKKAKPTTETKYHSLVSITVLVVNTYNDLLYAYRKTHSHQILYVCV